MLTMEVNDASIVVKKRPPKRTGHIAFSYDKYMFIWGGYSDEDHYDYYLPAKDLWIYDIQFGHWMRKRTSKPYPPCLSGCCACVIESTLYMFGGHGYDGNSNQTYKLDIKSFTWSRIDTDGLVPSPRDKCTSWSYDNKFYVFGGFGINVNGYLHDNGKYVEDPSTYGSLRGWNNQLLVLDTETEMWSNPKCNGTVPSPRAAHGSARIGSKVYLFGGRYLSRRLNDLYSLDLLTLIWNRELTSESTGTDMPCGRSWHTFSPVSETVIFLYGGFTQEEVPLSDAWLLDISVMNWTQLLHISPHRPRLWHTACVSKSNEVIIHGGCSNNILDSEHPTKHCREVFVLNLQPYSLLRLCLEAVYSYKHLTESDWNCLPDLLSHWLQSKSKLSKVVQNLQRRESVTSENGEEQHHPSGPTCAVS